MKKITAGSILGGKKKFLKCALIIASLCVGVAYASDEQNTDTLLWVNIFLAFATAIAACAASYQAWVSRQNSQKSLMAYVGHLGVKFEKNSSGEFDSVIICLVVHPI